MLNRLFSQKFQNYAYLKIIWPNFLVNFYIYINGRQAGWCRLFRDQEEWSGDSDINPNIWHMVSLGYWLGSCPYNITLLDNFVIHLSLIDLKGNCLWCLQDEIFVEPIILLHLLHHFVLIVFRTRFC